MSTQSDLAKRQAKKNKQLADRQAAKDAKKGGSPSRGHGKANKGSPKTETAKGEIAVNNGIGQDALAAGENIANRYIPAAQQVDTSASAGQQAAAAQLSGNVASNSYVTGGLDLQRQYAQRSAAQQDVLNRQNDIAKNGLNAQEYQGLREQMQNGLNSSLNTNMSQLARAQARGKVYGAAASAQQANALNAADTTRANNEQQLMLKSGDIRRQGLVDYSNTLNTQDQNLAANANNYSAQAQAAQTGETTRGVSAAAQANTLANDKFDREKFNIGEIDATTAARLGTIMDTAGIVTGQKTTKAQEALGADAIQAAGGSVDNYTRAQAEIKKQEEQSNAADAALEEAQNPAPPPVETPQAQAPRPKPAAKPKTPAQHKAAVAKKAVQTRRK